MKYVGQKHKDESTQIFKNEDNTNKTGGWGLKKIESRKDTQGYNETKLS